MTINTYPAGIIGNPQSNDIPFLCTMQNVIDFHAGHFQMTIDPTFSDAYCIICKECNYLYLLLYTTILNYKWWLGGKTFRIYYVSRVTRYVTQVRFPLVANGLFRRADFSKLRTTC